MNAPRAQHHSRHLLPVLMVLLSLTLAAALQWKVAEEIANDRAERYAGAATEASNLARAFEEHVAGALGSIDSLLLHLRETWLHEPANFGAAVGMHSSHLPPGLVVQIAIADASGKVRFSSIGANTGIDLSDREHFRVHRDQLGDHLFISKPVVGRISGKLSLQFTRRLTGANGRFAGVIVASLDPGYFTRFYDSIDVGRRGAITLLGMDRVIRARASGMQPAVDPIGRPLPAERPFFDLQQPAAGIYRVPSAVDGVTRLGAYRRVARYPLVVLVLLAEDEVFAAVEERATRLRIGASVVGLVILAAAIGMAMLARRQQAVTEALQAANRHLQADEEKLRWLAATDVLTGMPNRRTFEERGRHEFGRALRYRRPLSLAIVDIDHFKVINDTHGHQVGDHVLQQLARLCTGCVRSQDTFARIGGEEFGLLLPETDLAAAREVAEKLRAAVAGLSIEAAGMPVTLTVSVGVAAMAPGDAGLDALFSRADNALYAAKASGRNRVEVGMPPEAGHGEVHAQNATA